MHNSSYSTVGQYIWQDVGVFAVLLPFQVWLVVTLLVMSDIVRIMLVLFVANSGDHQGFSKPPCFLYKFVREIRTIRNSVVRPAACSNRFSRTTDWATLCFL